VSDNLIRRVQSVQNGDAAARLLTGAGRRDHISPVLQQLHCLPVQRRVDYKLACFVFSSLSGHAPPYLADDILLVSEGHRRRLRSSTTDRVPFHAHTTHSAAGASLSPGHVFGTVFRLTCATRTLHTTVSGVNSKRFCFNFASAAVTPKHRSIATDALLEMSCSRPTMLRLYSEYCDCTTI